MDNAIRNTEAGWVLARMVQEVAEGVAAMHGERGTCKSIEQLERDGDMPQCYAEAKRLLGLPPAIGEDPFGGVVLQAIAEPKRDARMHPLQVADPDYAQILVKYMAIIIAHEGIDYIDHAGLADAPELSEKERGVLTDAAAAARMMNDGLDWAQDRRGEHDDA